VISFVPPIHFCIQEVVDENEQVFYHHQSTEDRAHEVLSAEISKLSVNDKSKAK
jgi:hypothetical protein